MSELTPTTAECLARIRDILTRSRHQALQAVNAAMVQAYWEIGREIVEEEQRGADRARYGARLIETVATQLTQEFGKGFDRSNLWNMRAFYLAYPILDAVRRELSWTHYRLLLRVRNPQARAFYEVECVKARWSTRELERQVNSLLYERLALSRDKEELLALAEEGHEIHRPEDLVKDPYVLEFTGLPEPPQFQETELEQALMDRLQAFLLELGRDFFFVARQKRITLDGDHFFIDLVFYHRTLRCFVLMDLKTGKLTHEDIGQMLMYVGYYEAEETREGENPPVGLILCTDKNEAVVRYTLSQTNLQVFASRYQLYLPTEEELRVELERERDALERERRLQTPQEEVMNPVPEPVEEAQIAAFADYLTRAGTSRHTARAYLRWIREFVVFLEQSGRAFEITLADEHERTFAARDFRQYLKHTRRLAPASVNQALAALHTFCQFRGFAPPDVKREDLPQLAPRALSAEEQRRLLRAIERMESARDRAIASTLYYSGLRIGECAALDLNDVIVSDRQGKLIVRKGKGDRQREVPLHPAARKALMAWKQERQEKGVLSPTPAFFLNHRGVRLSARSIDKLMDRLADEAQIELSAHVLRHTFATNLIRQGSDLVVVAEITGHARLETVRRYSLPTHADLQKAVDGLPEER